MKKRLIIGALLLTSTIVNANNFIGEYSCINENSKSENKEFSISINSEGVISGEMTYLLNKEKVLESWGVSTSEGGRNQKCIAKTSIAIQQNENTLILVEMHRSRKSITLGLLCGLARHSKMYDDPFSYSQIIIEKKGEVLNLKRTTFLSAIGQPNLTLEMMKDPNLTTENQEIATYIESAKTGKYPKVYQGTASCKIK